MSFTSYTLDAEGTQGVGTSTSPLVYRL